MSFAATAGSFASVVSAPVQAPAESSVPAFTGPNASSAFAVRDNVVVLPLVGIVRLGGLLLIELLITAGCGPPN
jgi:hypothetical protein